MNQSEKNGQVLKCGDACDLVEVIDFNEEEYCEQTFPATNGQDFLPPGGAEGGLTRWINIDGQCAEEGLEELGRVFDIHPLVMENIKNTRQRPKIEEYEDFLYIVAKMIYYSEGVLVVEHLSFLLGRNFLISIGEATGDVFGNIRSRIRSEGTQIRKHGADYLLYSLLAAIVDGYSDVLDVLNEKTDLLEEQVMKGASQEQLHTIREMKKNLLMIGRSIWPLRDVASLLEKESAGLIRPSTEPYIRDLYGYIDQVIDTADTSRELLTGLAELHISNAGNKLNEIMKILTVISTIFMPLTFIVGIYGMNFRYMPEIPFKWGYLIVWLVMIAIAVFMIRYFKKKKWF